MTTAQMKARSLRYKKAALAELNLEHIKERLWDIMSECDDVRYFVEEDEKTLLKALDGDEEEEFEFKMMFSELSAECDQLEEVFNQYSVYDGYVAEYFDDFLVGIMLNNENPFSVVGFDSYEEDYFRLMGYDIGYAENESHKRLMRLTKKDILDAAGACFRVAVCFLNIERKYDYLKAAFDILLEKNTSFLQVIRDIDKEFEKADNSGDWHKFDRLVAALPDKAWVE